MTGNAAQTSTHRMAMDGGVWRVGDVVWRGRGVGGRGAFMWQAGRFSGGVGWCFSGQHQEWRMWDFFGYSTTRTLVGGWWCSGLHVSLRSGRGGALTRSGHEVGYWVEVLGLGRTGQELTGFSRVSSLSPCAHGSTTGMRRVSSSPQGTFQAPNRCGSVEVGLGYGIGRGSAPAGSGRIAVTWEVVGRGLHGRNGEGEGDHK